MDEFTKHRLIKEYGDDPLFDLYMYVFREAKTKEWCNSPQIVHPECAKAIVYETLGLVREWYNKSDLSLQ